VVPKNYSVTALYSVLRVCERFGWSLEYAQGLDPAEMRVLMDYEMIRTHEDAGAFQR
jgi:hypothetical protein